MGLELSQQIEDFFCITVFQFVDRPLDDSMVGLMATSSNRTYATCHASQYCRCQCLCPRGGPLLTHTSTGDPQTLTAGLAQSLVGLTASFPGSWCTQGLSCALQELLVGRRFDFKLDCVPPTVFLQLHLFPCAWGFFFWRVPTSFCRWLFAILVFLQKKLSACPSTLLFLRSVKFLGGLSLISTSTPGLC